uniref:Uncharacterized protein n=1 Tax=Oryza sativa subsp. japonica TaxID=39947 RepID=Q6ZKG6_ORYSJ|nr:hypothetical protein [Oryza sativa Japonica Group]
MAAEWLGSHRARELTVRHAVEVEGIVKLRPLYASRGHGDDGVEKKYTASALIADWLVMAVRLGG